MKNLNRLYWLNIEIKQIESQIKELSVLKGSTINGMPASRGVSSPVEQFVLKVERLTEKLNKKHDELVAETERIEAYIESIEDAEVRTIARARFIDNEDYETIGDKVHMHRTTVARTLNRYIERRTKDEAQI